MSINSQPGSKGRIMGPFQTPWPMLFGLYWKRAARWGVLASMGGGLTSALLWIGIGSLYGLHGFIPGILVSLLAMVSVSLFTKQVPDDHLARVWGER